MAAWNPTNFEDVCKRNAGRRKLHRRMRQARADRIVRILASIDAAKATELRESAYGWLTITAQAMNLSKATASRDFALVRRIHRQFERLFGRGFDPKKDQIVWSWHFDHYAFKAPESKAAGYPKPVGHFPFDTRKQETEGSYGGFSPSSWRNNKSSFISQVSTRDLIRTLTRLRRLRPVRF